MHLSKEEFEQAIFKKDNQGNKEDLLVLQNPNFFQKECLECGISLDFSNSVLLKNGHELCIECYMSLIKSILEDKIFYSEYDIEYLMVDFNIEIADLEKVLEIQCKLPEDIKLIAKSKDNIKEKINQSSKNSKEDLSQYSKAILNWWTISMWNHKLSSNSNETITMDDLPATVINYINSSVSKENREIKKELILRELNNLNPKDYDFFFADNKHLGLTSINIKELKQRINKIKNHLENKMKDKSIGFNNSFKLILEDFFNSNNLNVDKKIYITFKNKVFSDLGFTFALTALDKEDNNENKKNVFHFNFGSQKNKTSKEIVEIVTDNMLRKIKQFKSKRRKKLLELSFDDLMEELQRDIEAFGNEILADYKLIDL